MAGRRPAEAVENFIAPIREAVSCVIRQPALVTNQGVHPRGNPHPLVLNEGLPVRMGNSGLSLALNQLYDIVKVDGERGPFKVSTREYIYALHDKNGELVSFHYHPQSGIDFCHMHLRQHFRKVHFPTGRVAIEEVVALAIRDLGVPHRRDDYEEVLRAGLEKFREWRTWHSRGTM